MATTLRGDVIRRLTNVWMETDMSPLRQPIRAELSLGADKYPSAGI
jgi:hypothetical protein